MSVALPPPFWLTDSFGGVAPSVFELILQHDAAGVRSCVQVKAKELQDETRKVSSIGGYALSLSGSEFTVEVLGKLARAAVRFFACVEVLNRLLQ